MAATPDHLDPLSIMLDSLDELLTAADENIDRAQLIKRRIYQVRRQVEAGKSVTVIAAEEPRPLIVELITSNIEALQDVGSKLRWAEASALRAEGLTVAAIARIFGVTRQRVSALLLNPPRSARSSRDMTLLAGEGGRPQPPRSPQPPAAPSVIVTVDDEGP